MKVILLEIFDLCVCATFVFSNFSTISFRRHTVSTQVKLVSEYLVLLTNIKGELREKKYEFKAYEGNLKKIEEESSLNVIVGISILYGLNMYIYIQRELNSNSKPTPLFSFSFYRLFLL